MHGLAATIRNTLLPNERHAIECHLNITQETSLSLTLGCSL